MTLIRRVAAVSVLSVAIPTGIAGPPVLAQVRATTADLSGVVFDQSQAVVPGAAVTATHSATGLERSTVTGAHGRYAIPALPPGLYTIVATFPGFGATRVPNVRLVLGEAFVLDLQLQVAGTSEHVVVAAGSALCAMRQPSVATVVPGSEIESLPTNGRNVIAFALITPGVNVDRTPQQGASASSGLTFVGQRGRSNNITVDGLDNNDFVAGGVRATFSQEAVQDFQVLASSYPAEFGKAAGGVVNIVTKSGTNTTSGSLFTYFRDDALNATEHFERFEPDGRRIVDQPKAPYRQHQFGGTVGGPLRRNRSFFFLSAERLRVKANNFVNIPSEAAQVLQRAGFAVELGHVPFRYESDQVLAKVDRTSTRHQLSLRFNWADLLDENIEPWGGLVARSRGAYLDGGDVLGAASLMSVFSSRTVNELRLLVANRDQKVISFDPRCNRACDTIDEGGPAIDIGSIHAGRHAFTPQPRKNRRYQVVDTLSHAVGRHELKFGGDVSWVHQPTLAWPYAFGGRYAFLSLEALELGQPFVYVQGYGNPSADNKWFSYLSLFAQDTWHASDRFTLQWGLRYQNQFFPRLIQKVAGLPTYDWPADNNDVAPRLGLAWKPGPNARTSFTAAYGMFYDHHPGVIWGAPYVLSGTADHTRVFVASPPTARDAWRAPERRLPEQASYPSLVTTIDPGLKTPFTHHASLGANRTLHAGITISIRGVYARGFDQVGQLNYNPMTDRGRPLDVDGVRGTSASVMQFTSWADSWYRGLIVSVHKHVGGRSQFLAVYTVSKAEDMATDYASSQPQENGFGHNRADPKGLPLGFNPDAERGPSLQDQRHRFVLSGLYLLPARITVSGIVTLGSGRPFNITAGFDRNRDGATDNDRPWEVGGDLATRIGRNAGLLPGTSTVDVRVAKRMTAGGSTLELMLEMFNLFNHTNYTAVDAVFGDGVYPGEPKDTFGQFTKAGPPFQAQLAVKFSF